jgi:hypothetical protein
VTINEICDILRKELLNNDYKYGFIVDNHKYTPNMTGGFDNEYYNLTMTVYRIQNPLVTMKEKIGTCIDACLVMKYLLNKFHISSKIWLLHNKMKNKVHTILTFEAESKIVYLELTPQSKNPYYGKEKLYDNIVNLLSEFQNEGIDIEDVTEQLVVGEQPLILINKTIR